MKKSKLIKQLAISFFCISFLFFTSCQEEEIPFNNSEIHSKANIFEGTIRKINYKELIQNKELKKNIKIIREFNKKKPNERSLLNSEYNFIINTTHATYIEKNGNKSYTFSIRRISPSNLLENLVLSQNKSGSYDAFLVTYNDEKSINNTLIKKIDFDSNSILNRWEYNWCVTLSYEITTWPNCTYPNGIHPNGVVCNPQTSTVIVGEDCSTVWEDDNGGAPDTTTGSTGGNTFGSSSGGTTGGTVNNSGTETVITTPTPLTPEDNFVNDLILNNNAVYEWLMNNQDIYDSMIDYLESTITNSKLTTYPSGALQYVQQILNEIPNAPNSPLPSNVSLIRPTVNKQITNINQYLKCFNKSQSAVFTIFVDQPTANSNSAWSGNPLSPEGPNVGHTFIAIKQGTIRRVLGFYPTSAVDLDNPNAMGILEDNSVHEFDVSLSFPISPSQLTNLLNYIQTHCSSTYNLNTFNCTDFGMGASKSVGLALPSAYGTWGLPGIGSGSGDNPGQLGQNIRNLTISSSMVRTLATGKAPSNMGTCP